jgi:hypothetical protein
MQLKQTMESYALYSDIFPLKFDPATGDLSWASMANTGAWPSQAPVSLLLYADFWACCHRSFLIRTVD